MAALDSKAAKVAGKRNRSQFVRPTIPRVEQTASAFILILIVGIGAAIWIKGKRFDPNRYSLRPDALQSTANSVQGKASTLRMGRSDGGTEGTPNETPAAAAESGAGTPAAKEGGAEEGAATTAAAKPATGEPMEISLAGIKPMGPTEFYNAETLYEKIDGRSPAYVSFNCQQLRYRSFTLDGTAGSYVDVYGIPV